MDPATDWVVSENGYALDFDGSNDLVNCGNSESLDITGEVTIIAWFKAAASDQGYVVAKGSPFPDAGRYNLYWDGNNNELQWWFGEVAPISSDAVFTDTDWVQATATMDMSGNVAWYRNGVAAGTDSVAPLISNSADLYFGNRVGGSSPSHFFAGLIGCIGIWDRVLSPSEIQQLYLDPLAPLRLRDKIFPVASDVAPPTGAIMNQIIGGGIFV